MTLKTFTNKMNTLKRAFNRDLCLPRAETPILHGLPTAQEMTSMSSDEVERSFTEWENGISARMDEDHERLEAAQIRIALCTFLDAAFFMSLFAPAKERGHYPWCVCKEWDARYNLNEYR